MRFQTKPHVLFCMMTLLSFASALPSLMDSLEHVNGIIESEDTDGYDVATIHAVEPDTSEETRQTKRDIEAHSGSPINERTYSLQLSSSGQRLRMSVQRRSVNFSGATFTELTEDGQRETIPVDPTQCFFSGKLHDGEGVASLALCDGEVVGSIHTPTRTYQLHTLPRGGQDISTNDDNMQILVTWQDNDDAILDDNDGLDIPEEDEEEEDASEETERERRSLADHKGTIEICDVVDQYFVADVKRKLHITNSSKIVQLLISKWTGAAFMLSNVSQVGWDLDLRLVRVDIMRSNPDWYKAKPKEKMGARLNEICRPTGDWKCDQISLHTGQTTDLRIVGLAWVKGLCKSTHRCSSLRNSGRGYIPELHELGHNMGLKHDGKERRCVNGTDPVKGFMGSYKHHFRQCYKQVLASSLRSKKCIFSDYITNSSEIVKDFHRDH